MTPSSRATSAHSVEDLVGWAAFVCVLVPVVLVVYGTSLAGAGGAALGLALVTGVCRALLRRSERGTARLCTEPSPAHRARHGRPGTGARAGGRHGG
nr:hypothetical protein [Streptomyces indicus]